MDGTSDLEAFRSKLLEEILRHLNDEHHIRLVRVYKESGSVEKVEAELTQILLEVVGDED